MPSYCICQSVSEVQFTGVAPLGVVSHRFIFLIRHDCVDEVFREPYFSKSPVAYVGWMRIKHLQHNLSSSYLRLRIVLQLIFSPSVGILSLFPTDCCPSADILFLFSTNSVFPLVFCPYFLQIVALQLIICPYFLQILSFRWYSVHISYRLLLFS